MNFVFGLESHPQGTSLGIGKCPIIPKNLKSETLWDLCILGEGESPAVRRVRELCCPRCLRPQLRHHSSVIYPAGPMAELVIHPPKGSDGGPGSQKKMAIGNHF